MRWNRIILYTVLHICLLIQELSSETVATHHGGSSIPKDIKGNDRTIKPSRSRGPKIAHYQDNNFGKKEFGEWLVPGAEGIEKCGFRIGHTNYARPSDPTTTTPIDTKNTTRAKRDRTQAAVTTSTYAGEFPSYALIKVGEGAWNPADDNQGICAGALVGPSLVLTAAHCLDQLPETRKVFVTLGINSPGKEHQRTVHAFAFCFPENACERDSEFLDFAFLRLKYPVNYTTYIQPACLLPALNPGKEFLLGDFQFASTGFDQFGNHSTALRKSHFKRGCGDIWQEGYKWMRRSVECYLSMRGSQPCALDFGGPMYAVGRVGQMLGKHIVVGISSFNANQICEAKPRKPSYFMEVTRLKADLRLSMSNCRNKLGVGSDYAEKKCFKPKKMKNQLDPRIDFDEYVNMPNRSRKHKESDLMDPYLPVRGGEPLQTCGLKGLWADPFNEENGRDSLANEIPSYVQFSYDGIKKQPLLRCGGALIGPKLIVTSASCVADKRNLVAHGGMTGTKSSNRSLGFELPVKDVCLYPRWCSLIPEFANLAFVKLKQPVRYTDEIYPACFFPKYNPFESTYGNDTFKGMSLSYGVNFTWEGVDQWKKRDWPRQISFHKKPMPNKDCWREDPWMDFQSSCFKDKSRCSMDVGSPLYDRNPELNDRVTVIGISSRTEILSLAPDFRKCHPGLLWPSPLYPRQSFTNIFKVSRMIDSILDNCQPADSIDPDELEESCYIIEREIKTLNGLNNE